MKKSLLVSLTLLPLLGASCMTTTTTNTNINTNTDVVTNENLTDTMPANTNEDTDMVGDDAMMMKVRSDIAGVVSTDGWKTYRSADPLFAYMYPADWDASSANAAQFTVSIEPANPADMPLEDDATYVNGQPFYLSELDNSVMYTTYTGDVTVTFAYTDSGNQANADTFITILSTLTMSENPMGVFDGEDSDLMLQ